MTLTPEEIQAENLRLRAALAQPTQTISADEAAALGIKGTSSDDPSGAKLAEAARAAGVVQPSVEVPNFDVTLHFVYRGTLEDAEKLRDDLLFALLQMGNVQQPIDNSVAERVIGAEVSG